MTSILLVTDADVPETDLDDATASYYAAALGDWLNKDLGPRYSQGIYHVGALPRNAPLPPASPNLWLIHMIRNSEIPGAFGYHHRDSLGTPVGYVAVETIIGAGWGQVLFSVLGHEAAEMVGNRYINEWVGDDSGQAFFKELCDPSEGNLYTHTFRGNPIPVPDYVLPSYWRIGAPGPYSRMNLCPGPFQPARGGRQAVASLTNERQLRG